MQGLSFATFGGNPVTMAAALATIEYIEENDLLTNAAERGAELRARLDTMQKAHPFIGDVRGMGLMQALELVKPGTDKEPDADRANAILAAARDRGLLIGKGGLYNNTIRIAPHLNVSAADIQTGCDILAEALKAVK